jgi:hypothetical protein
VWDCFLGYIIIKKQIKKMHLVDLYFSADPNLSFFANLKKRKAKRSLKNKKEENQKENQKQEPQNKENKKEEN